MEQLKLNTINFENYLYKLKGLEKHASLKNLRFLTPEELGFPDDLNSLAKVIGTFLGIKKPIIVYPSKQKEKVGGNFTEDDAFIYIELEHGASQKMEWASGIICHELMHYVLKNMGIVLSDNMENEVLTDVASVYFGLGYIILRGLLYKDIKYNNNENKSLTKTMSYGYIDKNSFAILHAFIAKIKDVEIDKYLSNHEVIEPPAIKEMKNLIISIQNNPIYKSAVSQYGEGINKAFKDTLSKNASLLAEFDRNLKAEQDKYVKCQKTIIDTNSLIKTSNNDLYLHYNILDCSECFRRLDAMLLNKRITANISTIEANIDSLTRISKPSIFTKLFKK